MSTFQDFKNIIRSIVGGKEDSSGTWKGYVGQLCQRHVYHAIDAAPKGSTFGALGRMAGQTDSVSASQPIKERVVFCADQSCEVKSAFLSLHRSATITNTVSTSWTAILAKRGGSVGSYGSTTVSISTHLGALTTDTGKYPSLSGSASATALTRNLAYVPNPLLLTSIANNATRRQLIKGEVVTFRVKKGGAANDSGAIFTGGLLKLIVEEG